MAKVYGGKSAAPTPQIERWRPRFRIIATRWPDGPSKTHYPASQYYDNYARLSGLLDELVASGQFQGGHIEETIWFVGTHGSPAGPAWVMCDDEGGAT